MADPSIPRHLSPALAFRFDPHPFGCPVGLRVPPADMPEIVTSLCVRVRDRMHSSIFVINPSKGQSYPVLFLAASAEAPKLALFPAWEDEARARRVDYGRQVSLLQRIADAGVPGESLETWSEQAGLPVPVRGAAPLLVPLAAAIPEAQPLLRDVYERLLGPLRMTISRIPMARGRPDLAVMRCYAPDEPRARMVWFPGWASPGDKDLIDNRRMELLLQRSDQHGVVESPADGLFGA